MPNVWRFGAPPYAIGASTPSAIKATVISMVPSHRAIRRLSEQVKQLSVMHQTCWAYQPEVDTALCQALGGVSRLAGSVSAAWALEGGKKRGRVQKAWPSTYRSKSYLPPSLVWLRHFSSPSQELCYIWCFCHRALRIRDLGNRDSSSPRQFSKYALPDVSSKSRFVTADVFHSY